ncbi:regulatory LuxR family protein [Hasllibacter halocynthiae]|uniref:Regulatory LuxR family protein n=1 Tax=Hasllibacter halocynthiae TaxID=595589 RepID=A0A2T0X769_9RHOB|nr:helix-turn-helix transcriptional regulator [Hasllibacter halocynthiae]PRY94776.1 regulatory LuxR family protein [Hasllibacter halocynthiae]
MSIIFHPADRPARSGALAHPSQDCAADPSGPIPAQLLEALLDPGHPQNAKSPLCQSGPPARRRPGVAHEIQHLSPRERDVLVLWSRGRTLKAIAAELGISPKTVETYKMRGSAKLGLRGRAAVSDYFALLAALS